MTLLDALAELKVDGAIGGARRDEEKARAKERVFSHRDVYGQWDPKNQRPELWSLYNGRRGVGEHIRIFPLSNWTELDVWQYVAHERIALPSLYFAHRRRVVRREGMLLAETPHLEPRAGERAEERTVRFRTVGDASCTGASGCATGCAATWASASAPIGRASTAPPRGSRADFRPRSSSVIPSDPAGPATRE